MVKNPPASAGDTRDVDSIPGLGRSPGVRNGNLFQYSLGFPGGSESKESALQCRGHRFDPQMGELGSHMAGSI